METQTMYELMSLGIPVITGAIGYFAGREIWKQEAQFSLRQLDKAVKLAYDSPAKNPGTQKKIAIAVLSDIKRDTERTFGVHLQHTRCLIDDLTDDLTDDLYKQKYG